MTNQEKYEYFQQKREAILRRHKEIHENCVKLYGRLPKEARIIFHNESEHHDSELLSHLPDAYELRLTHTQEATINRAQD